MTIEAPNGTLIGNGLQAAFLLARGRVEGLRLVQADMAGAARSFWAVALCVPGDLCLMLMGWARGGVPPQLTLPAQPTHVVALHLIAFAIGWAAYAVLSHAAVAALGRGMLWPRYIAAWNWCNVAQQLLMVSAGLLALLGAPDWAAETAEVVALGWSLWLEWFTARHALRIGVLAAASLVMLDVLIGLTIATAIAPFLLQA